MNSYGRYGRNLFGSSAIVFALVGLSWRHSDLWQLLQPLNAPLRAIVAWLLVIVLCAGGIAIMIPRTARLAAIAVGTVFGAGVLACLCNIVAAPADPGPYIDAFEELAIVCGAIAVFAMTEDNAARANLLGRVARLGLGVCCISFAGAQIVYLQYTATLVPLWIPPNQMFWTDLTTAAFALAAIALLIDRRVLVALCLLTAMTTLIGVLVWLPLILAHPGVLTNWSEVSENFLIAAAAWLVADWTFSQEKARHYLRRISERS